MERIFISTMMIFSCNLSTVNSFGCVSMNNREYKLRFEIVNVNSNESLFYPFSIKTNKCSGSCNNINDPHAKLCFPDVVKNVNVKCQGLMKRGV